MQMTHPNEELLRKGYEAYERGDGETVESVMADEIEWHLTPLLYEICFPDVQFHRLPLTDRTLMARVLIGLRW